MTKSGYKMREWLLNFNKVIKNFNFKQEVIMDDLTLLKIDLIFDKLAQMPENHIDTFNHSGVNFELKTTFLNGDILKLCIPKDINKFTIETADCSFALYEFGNSGGPEMQGYRPFPYIINEVNTHYGK